MTSGRHEDRDGDGVADYAEWELEAHGRWLDVKQSRPEHDHAEDRAEVLTPHAVGDPVAWGVDAAAPLSVAQVKAQGASFVCCYLAPYPSQAWKIRTPAQVRTYLDAGLSVVFNWEADGTPGNGFATGVSAAQQTQSQLNDRGFPDAPVIFTFADTGSPNLSLVAAAIQGCVSILGWSRVGAYGGINTIAYLADRNACAYLWQTYAWSSGRRDGRAQLYQRLNGAQLDFDVAYAADYGQIPRPSSTPSPATPPAVAKKVLAGMPDRSFPAGDSAGRIVCPVGKASLLVSRAWFSASVDGNADVEVWAQVSGGGDSATGAAPDAAAHRTWPLRRGDRSWFELPDGTEFVTYHVTGATGPGGVAVEQIPK